MFCSRARLSGYMSALEEKGILHDSTLIREGDFRTQSGYEQAMSLLRDVENRPTAIFGGSGLQCMGVYEAARQLGLRIPEDLSVVGFDDIQTSEFMGPPLTTVHQPLQEMASLATRLIMDIHANRVLLRTTILPVGLVVRNSTCAPRTVDLFVYFTVTWIDTLRRARLTSRFAERLNLGRPSTSKCTRRIPAQRSRLS